MGDEKRIRASVVSTQMVTQCYSIVLYFNLQLGMSIILKTSTRFFSQKHRGHTTTGYLYL